MENKLSFNIYPNPSQGEFKGQFNNIPNESGKLTVTDVNGKFISSQIFKAGSKAVNLNLTEKGLYFVTAEYKKYRVTKKVIVN